MAALKTNTKTAPRPIKDLEVWGKDIGSMLKAAQGIPPLS